MLLYEIDDGRFCLHNIIAGIKYVMAKQKSSNSLKERRKKIEDNLIINFSCLRLHCFHLRLHCQVGNLYLQLTQKPSRNRPNGDRKKICSKVH